MRLHERILLVGLLTCIAVLASTHAQLVVGGAGRCLSFMKPGQYAQVANLTALNQSRAFTVEMWARSFSPSQTFALFSLITPSRSRFAWTGAEGIICFNQLYTISELSYGSNAPQLNISASVWHHFAFVADADSATCTLFVDGNVALRAVAAPNGGATTSFGAPTLTIGQLRQDLGRVFDPSYSFIGQVDDVRIWNVARSNVEIRARMPLSIPSEPDVPNLVASYSFDRPGPTPTIAADHRNLTQLWLGSFTILPNRTSVSANTPPVLARSSCPVFGRDAPVVATTDRWTSIPINLKYIYLGSNQPPPEFRIVTLSQGSLFVLYPNGTSLAAEIGSPNTLIPYAAIYYKPNSLLFSSTGDYFTYEVSFSNPVQRMQGTVVIDDNSASIPRDIDLNLSANQVQNVVLPCWDANGEFAYVEILSLPLVGSIHQLQLSTLFSSKPAALAEPITSVGTILRHPSGAVGFIAPDNILSSVTASFQYRCLDKGAPVVSTAGTATIQIVPSVQSPLAGYGQYALQFDGIRSTAYSTLSDNSSVTIRTIELWAKFYSSPQQVTRAEAPSSTPQRQVLVQGMYDSVGQYFWSFFAQANNASNWRLGFGNANASASFEYVEQLSDPSVSIEPDKWHHLAVSIKEPSATFYVNGIRFGSPVNVGTLSVVRRIQLGALAVDVQDMDSSSLHFMGVMDEVRLWSSALDSPELSWSMQNSPRSTPLSLSIFIWDFNEGTGAVCVDSVRSQSLYLGMRDRVWNRPRWVVSDGPQFTTVVSRENDPVAVYLTAGTLAKQSYSFAYAIVELPRRGALYQANSTSVFRLGPKIETAYFDWHTPEFIQQWASSVLAWSSYRQAVNQSSMFHPLNAIGAPFNSTLFSSDSASAPAALFDFESLSFNGTVQNASSSSWESWPVSTSQIASLAPNGSEGLMWVPAGCNVSAPLDFIEVEYSTSVYPQKIEIFTSLAHESIKSVWVWDQATNSWLALFRTNNMSPDMTPEPVVSSPTLSVFSPPFCQTTRPTKRVRIEVDPCLSAPWTGIAGVNLVGSVDARPGLVTDPDSRIIYVPPPYESGANIDSFAFAAIACPYKMETATSPLRLSVDVEARNNAPLSSDLRLSTLEGSDVEIQLKGIDPDGDPIKFILSSIPSLGVLYQLTNDSQKAEPVTINGTVVRHPRGLLLWTPPRAGPSCGILFSNFSYFVTDAGSSSNGSFVIVDVNCTPGAYSITSGLLYTSWGIAAALLVFGVLLLALAILYKGHKSVRKSQPALLIIMLIGAIACYASVFMFSTRITDATCHIRIWILNIGITLTLGTLVVKMFHIWRMFSAKMFRRNSELTPTHTAIFLGILVALELGQLLVYSIVAAPYMQEEIDPTNNAIRHQSCQSATNFSPMYLFIYKGVLVVLTTCIYVLIRSVTKTRFKPESLEMLLFSVYGMFVSGSVAVPILLLVKDRDALFLLGCISIAAPVTICLILVFIPKIRSVLRKKRENNGDTIEQFTLRAMTSSPTNASTGGTPQKIGKKTAKRTGKKNRDGNDKPMDPTQNLMELSKFSEDKSVLELLEAIQHKDSEIAALKSKMVKTQYKMQNLKQRLMVTEGAKRGFGQDDDDYDL